MVELDEQITLWLNGFYNDGLDVFFFYLSWKYTWFILGAALLTFVFRKYGARQTFVFLLFVGVMILAADQICNIFKHGVQRFRPCWDESLMDSVHIVNGDRGGKYGFFSAHAAVFFGLALMTSRFIKNRSYTITIYAIAVLVAYSRIYLGRHFLGDVLVGAVEGTLIALASWHFYEKFIFKIDKKNQNTQKTIE